MYQKTNYRDDVRGLKPPSLPFQPPELVPYQTEVRLYVKTVRRSIAVTAALFMVLLLVLGA